MALFLDGLDEMAPAAQHQALTRIERDGAGLRIVLSSRPDEYRAAITEGRMHNAAVIAVQPVDPDEALAYLVHDQIGSQYDRWAQVGDYLSQHPGSVAAHTLNNPLTLSLARATYQDKDPAPLTDPATYPTVADLRTHLFERVLLVAYPDERRRAHATRWLAWMAHHMGSDRDLAWWHLPIWIPGWHLRLVVGLVVGLTVGFVVGFVVGLAGGPMPQVVLTELVLAVSGAGRVRFMKVLEEAHRRQVLRQAGALYQFRHAELQEYLAKIHQQRSRSSARS